MSASGGLSWERFVALVEREGLRHFGTRFECPARCCDDERIAELDPAYTEAFWRCLNCERSGDAVALISLRRNITEEEALDVLEAQIETGLFYGSLEAALRAKRIYVAVGYSDYLTLEEACVEFPDYATLGFPDLECLETITAIHEWKGRKFVLGVLNDEKGSARYAIERIGKKLTEAGARVRYLRPPPAFKTLTEWRGFEALPVRSPPEDPDPKPPGPDTRVTPHPKSTPIPLRKSYASLCQIFRTEALARLAYGERLLEYNEMSSLPTLNRVGITENDYRIVRESIERNIKSSFQTNRALEFSVADIESAFYQVGMERAFHPVREYLQRVEWDGEARLEKIHQHILHADVSTEAAAALIPVLIRKWFISAVARAMDPGCKVDTALILCGEQGAQKSTFFKVLAGEGEWFSDTSFDISDKDALMQIRDVWIYEWAELDQMQRARDQEAVKGFLTSGEDRFRRPYGRTIERHKRSCVIVGTTNRSEFLTDSTGNRRYWPVTITNIIDLDQLRAIRDQLWAEAVALYRAGKEAGDRHLWHLDQHEAGLLKVLQRPYELQDAWHDLIAVYVEGIDRVTIDRVLHECLEKQRGQWTRADQMRVAAVLVRLGFRRFHASVDGSREWVYRRVTPINPELF